MVRFWAVLAVVFQFLIVAAVCGAIISAPKFKPDFTALLKSKALSTLLRPFAKFLDAFKAVPILVVNEPSLAIFWPVLKPAIGDAVPPVR